MENYRRQPKAGTNAEKQESCLIANMEEHLFEIIAKKFDGRQKVSNISVVNALQSLDRRGRAYAQSRIVGNDRLEIFDHNRNQKQILTVPDFLERVRVRNTDVVKVAAATA